MVDPKRNLNVAPSEKPASGTDYFRENPGKATLALVSSLLTGFLVGVVIYFSLVRFLSLEPYLSIVFSSPVSTMTVLFSNSVFRKIILKRYR
jgi:F0F1-type ATP synthase assembly protein I